MQPVYLVCGVPGSGKTWVCRQLTDRFHYLPHDEHMHNHSDMIFRASRMAKVPVITECPFGERPLKHELEQLGIKVIPYFVVEKPITVMKRYRDRERKPASQAIITRATTIRDRVAEWGAPGGTSDEILELLRQV